MAKDKERILAKELYLLGKTGKEIAEHIGVTEKTVSRWVQKYGWREIRNAKLHGIQAKIDNIKQILEDLAEETVQINRQIARETDKEKIIELRKRRNQIADEAAKWNKALENIDRSGKIPFNTYLNVMDEIFKALRKYDEKLFFLTLDFQELHIQEKAKEY